MGRTSNARERLLDAACELMRTRAYGSVGVADICARADVRKGSFYHFFESKTALTLAAIDAHWRAEGTTWDLVLSAETSALTRLRRLLQSLATAQRQGKHTRGAIPGRLLINLTVELGSQDSLVRARLEEIFNEQISLVHAVLDDAVAEGSISASSSSRATARAILAHLEGLVLMAKACNDPDVLNDLWPQTLRLLRAARRNVPRQADPLDPLTDDITADLVPRLRGEVGAPGLA